MAAAAKPKRTALEHNRRMEINATRMREIVSTHHLDTLRADMGLSLSMDGQRRVENQ